MITELRGHLSRLGFWHKQSVERRIFAAVVTVGGATLVVKLASVVKEMAVARQFGTADALDAFLIAFLLPSFAINVVAGSLRVALLPTYVRVREQAGLQAAQGLLSGVMFWSLGLLLAISILLALGSSSIISLLASGFDPLKIALTRRLFFILLPLILLNGLSAVGAAVLNASGRYGVAAMAPVITPLLVGLSLWLQGGAGTAWGIYLLASATLFGGILEAILLVGMITQQGLSLRPRRTGDADAKKQVMAQYLPMLTGSVLMASTVLVDQSMAAMLGPGSVSALNYGGKPVAFVIGIAAVAIGTAVFPDFARLVTDRDWVGAQRTLRAYTWLIVVLTVPLLAVLVFWSLPIVRLLFERGAFTLSDARLVAQVNGLFALQIPFYLVGVLNVRMISALRANAVLMWGALGSLAVNVGLNLVFMRILGVAGIALSTSVVYVLSCLYSVLMVRRVAGRRRDAAG